MKTEHNNELHTQNQDRLLEKLAESEQRYRELIENLQEIVFTIDKQGCLVFLNRAWTQILGYTCTESIGHCIGYFLYPEDHQTELGGDHLSVRKELRFRHQNGQVVWLELSTHSITSEGLSGSLIDITERKRSQAELSKALAQKKELNALKSHFVTTISHEFRTPLTTILGSSELLKFYSHKLSEEKKQLHLERIQDMVHHMTQMLNDVVLLSEVEVGQLEFNPSPLDVIHFSHCLVDELKVSTGKQHTLVFTNQTQESAAVENPPLLGYLDEHLLQQILSNLLTNAIKYSPPGSQIDVELNCQNKEVSFSVKDQGLGIFQDDQERLFESFYRGKNVENIHGIGLGLTIVQKAVELHGGTITVESEVGIGTKFTVTIPWNQEMLTR